MSSSIKYPYLCSDGFCLGNPGPGGARVLAVDGPGCKPRLIMQVQFFEATNNLMEFVGAAAMSAIPGYSAYYTDSTTAIAWVRNKQVNTTFNIQSDIKLMTLINNLLRSLPAISVLEKWDTKNWGEIPADFGNK